MSTGDTLAAGQADSLRETAFQAVCAQLDARRIRLPEAVTALRHAYRKAHRHAADRRVAQLTHERRTTP